METASASSYRLLSLNTRTSVDGVAVLLDAECGQNMPEAGHKLFLHLPQLRRLKLLDGGLKISFSEKVLWFCKLSVS